MNDFKQAGAIRGAGAIIGEANARQDSPLRVEIDQLEKSVMVLNEQLQILEQRLYSVLQDPDRPEEARLAKDMSGTSAMTKKIYDITAAVHASNRHIGSLIDRLEV
jgi:hypothetical protein